MGSKADERGGQSAQLGHRQQVGWWLALHRLCVHAPFVPRVACTGSYKPYSSCARELKAYYQTGAVPIPMQPHITQTRIQGGAGGVAPQACPHPPPPLRHHP
eukprot:1152526-Pelagomonas_calceolata.AAC.11